MTEDRVKAIYHELDSLSMQVDMAPERGPTYLLEMLTTCRRRQDRAVQLLVEVRRARVVTKRAVRALKETEGLTVDPVMRASTHRDWGTNTDHLDELTTLEGCLNVTRSNLRMADSDIRLAERLMEQQRQLGTIKAPPVSTLPVPDGLGHVDLSEPDEMVVSLDDGTPLPTAPVTTNTVSAADVEKFLGDTSPPVAEAMSMDELVDWVRSSK